MNKEKILKYMKDIIKWTKKINYTISQRIIDTKWNLLATSHHLYNSKIQIQYLDRPALMTDVLNILGYLKAQIQSIDANNKLKENHGSLKILIKVSNIERLHQIISSIKKIPDIIAINRIIM